MRDGSAEILFQSFLQEALVSSSGMGRDVPSSISSADRGKVLACTKCHILTNITYSVNLFFSVGGICTGSDLLKCV